MKMLFNIIGLVFFENDFLKKVCDAIVLGLLDIGLVVYSFGGLALITAAYIVALLLTAFCTPRTLYAAWRNTTSRFIDKIVDFQYWTELEYLNDRK